MAIAIQDNMKPGRELDALVAEEVMGDPYPYDNMDGIGESGVVEENLIIFTAKHVPPYSTDISPAEQVLMKIPDEDEAVFIDFENGLFTCGVRNAETGATRVMKVAKTLSH